jgi:hypothetical protein
LTLQCTSLQLLHPKIHSELRLRAARTELEACILVRPVTMDRIDVQHRGISWPSWPMDQPSGWSSSNCLIRAGSASAFAMSLGQCTSSMTPSKAGALIDAPLCVGWMALKTNHVLPATQIQNTTNTY